MVKYILKRLALMVVTLFIVITLTFFLMRAIPGGPFSFDRVIPPNVEAAMNAKYHLDQPLFVQYLDYLKAILRFDFGPSFVYFGQTVNDMISLGLPKSSQIGLLAIIVIVMIGLPLGITAALNRNKWQDRTVMAISTIGVVVPSFVLATVMLYFFSIKLKLLPTFGLDNWKSYIMPVIALSIGSLSGVARLTRSSMLDVLNQDYIRTAYSKGLSNTRIVFVHVLRNSLIPVITSLGMTFAALLTGSFAVEKIYAIPGLGRYFVETISNRDYTAVMGLTILTAGIMVVAVFIIDIVYILIDPRIKLYKK